MSFSVPDLKLAGEAYIGEDGRLYETVPSYFLKMMKLGTLVGSAVMDGRIKLPTRIMSIPRGSLLPTDTVARMLGLTGDKVISYGLSLYNDEELGEQFKVGQIPTRDLVEGEVVLIVDEVADTTKTMMRAKADILELGPAALYTAVVYDKVMPGTERPDFSADFTDKPDRWIVFPNEPLDAFGKVLRNTLAQL